MEEKMDPRAVDAPGQQPATTDPVAAGGETTLPVEGETAAPRPRTRRPRQPRAARTVVAENTEAVAGPAEPPAPTVVAEEEVNPPPAAPRSRARRRGAPRPEVAEEGVAAPAAAATTPEPATAVPPAPEAAAPEAAVEAEAPAAPAEPEAAGREGRARRRGRRRGGKEGVAAELEALEQDARAGRLPPLPPTRHEPPAEPEAAIPVAGAPAARVSPLPEPPPAAPGELAVLAAGEPIPLVRRAEAPPPVLVPEAVAVLPAPVELEEAGRAGGPGRAAAPLPASTEATVSGPRSARARRGRRGAGRPAVPREEIATAPPPPGEAVLVAVPEALLEAPPGEIVSLPGEEELTLRVARALPSPVEPAVEAEPGRRRRGRGPRERADDHAGEPVPARRGEHLLVRAEEEERDRRDRERAAEARTEREYKEILVSVEDRETRIAVLEAGRLVELHVEREERVVNAIYRARVANVLPGMDAAFVDIGLDRNAFLYVGDILFEDPVRGGNGEAPVRRTSRDVRIRDVARPGQEIMVQVVKGPRGTKGARVSTRISLPGRYLVLMPEGDHLGISRKIEDPRERDRLKRIIEPLHPRGFGIIVRTEAEGRSETELRQDLEYLNRTWQTIVERNQRAHGPTLLHKELGIILKTIRDLFGSDVDKLVLDSREEYEKAVDALTQLAPDLVERVHLYEGREPLFIKYNLEEEIERLLRRKVWLRNGAYLLIDATEALTTIDVNTGKFVGTSSLAETILKTNLDAAEEIARQLRLRDIGGMIVLDFIDMASAKDRQQVMRALETALRKDQTRIKIAHISPLGLVEMTRKRTGDTLTDTMSHVCPYCQGRGRVWSPETMAIQIEREIRRRCAREEIDALLVYASPEVAEQLIGPEGENVERLERLLRRPVYVRARHDYHVEKWEVVPAEMLEMERQMLPFHGGEVVECRVVPSPIITPPRAAAWTDGYFVDVANGARLQGQPARVRLVDVRRSFALGEVVPPAASFDRSEPI